MMSVWWWILVCYLHSFVFKTCGAVVYHLNDTEYDRMPPLFGLDPYEPCLREPNGIYCMIELDLIGDADNKLMNLITEYSEYTVKHYNHSYIQRGVCVQETCKSFSGNTSEDKVADLSKTLEECFNDSLWRDYGLTAKLTRVEYCNKHGDIKRKDISDWIILGIFIAILVLNLIGSCYDIFFVRLNGDKNRRKGNQYLLSLSVLQNWKWLTSAAPGDPRIERLTGLHSYKTITIFFMVVSHVMWVNSVGFTVNTHDFEKGYDTIYYQLVFNGMMIIQIFIVISGFLMVYNILIRCEKGTISLKIFPKILFLRWWRLTPAYAVMLAFTTTWLRHMGSGPLWRLWVADSVCKDCRSYWWMHLLYVHNYFPDDRFCAIQTWYLAADMQVFAIGLLAFLATKSRGRLLVLSLLLVLGLVAPALHAWLQDLDGVMIMKPEFYRKKLGKAFEVHVLGHNYLSCYVIGMGTACLLYHLQKKGIDKKSNKILQVLSWCIVPAFICLFYSGQVFYADAPRTALAARVLWAAAHRLIMSAIVAFAILGACMRFSESFCAVVEWPGWVVPSRLSYSVYLLHLNFINLIMGNRSYLAQVSFYNMVITHLGIVALSFIAAVPFYLMVEGPSTRLMKVLTGPQENNQLKTKLCLDQRL